MKQFNLSISGAIAEKPMRNILGMNNIPRNCSTRYLEYERKFFDALKLKHIRFHDATIENAAFKLMDISRIFPLFHLDENDSRNYCFAQTDDYLAYLKDKDVSIDFRLGETIDHSGNGRLIGVPGDLDKWARICRNIIGHYKNGEMNGMHLNITRVTVWEEPDNIKLFTGTVDDYSRMFCKVYKLLKRDFPDILVGGPTMRTREQPYLTRFLEVCKEEGVAPDYISSTRYSSEVGSYVEELEKCRKVTDSFGLKDIKHTLVEWHLEPNSWDPLVPGANDNLFQTDSAAFSCTLLTQLMNLDYLDAAYYYSWALGMWSAIQLKKPLLPVYYGLLFFQKLAAECAQRLQVETDADNSVTCLAGIAPDGKQRLLISCFSGASCAISCHFPGAKACSVLAIREDYCEKDALEAVSLPESDGCFTLQHDGKNGVYLLEFV